MAKQLFSNFASSRLASSITSGATSLSVQAGDGALFPTITGSDFFYLVLVSSSDREIVKVTAVATDTFTVVRAQEGTSAAAFDSGATVELRLTAATMTAHELIATDSELTAIAGLTSAAGKGIEFTGAGAAATFDLTTAGKALLDDANAAAQRTTLGLGTVATLDSDTDGTLAANSDSKVATQKAVKTYADKQKEVLIIAVSDETTAITTGSAKVTFRMPFAMTLTEVRASLTTQSSSGNPAIDVNESGVSIFSTTLTIDSGEKTSTTAATPAVISDSSLADDAEMTIDIDTAGTGAAGLKVYLIGTRT